jgi:hypothetical protein
VGDPWNSLRIHVGQGIERPPPCHQENDPEDDDSEAHEFRMRASLFLSATMQLARLPSRREAVADAGPRAPSTERGRTIIVISTVITVITARPVRGIRAIRGRWRSFCFPLGHARDFHRGPPLPDAGVAAPGAPAHPAPRRRRSVPPHAGGDPRRPAIGAPGNVPVRRRRHRSDLRGRAGRARKRVSTCAPVRRRRFPHDGHMLSSARSARGG